MDAALQPVRDKWSRSREPAGWTWLDAGLATALLIVLVTEIVPNPEMTPHPLLLGLSVVVTVPLAWRRVHAGSVAVIVCAGDLAMTSVATGPFPPQLAAFPLLIALFFGGLGTRGASAVGFGAVTLTLTVTSWILTEEGDARDFWPYLLWAGTWLSGTLVRRRGDLAANHARRAAQLEAEARLVAAESAQRERDRIARELHDVVAHSVSVMVVQAGAERLRLGTEAGRTGTVLAAIEESGRSALTELRTMLGVLRDGSVEDRAPLPGISAIPALVERVRATGLPIELSFQPSSLEPGSEPDIVGAAGLAAFRIVQEALTNVVRHAGPVRTRVSVEGAPDSVTVSVTNDPPQASLASRGPGAGRGLAGMRERAVALGGTFTACDRPDGGFEVTAVVPLQDAAVPIP